MEAAGTTCASYFLRHLDKPAEEFTSEDAYFSEREFGSGVACSLDGRIVALPWQSKVVRAGDEVMLDLWDVFRLGGKTYMVIDALGCSGECRELGIYAVERDTVKFIDSLLLWSL